MTLYINAILVNHATILTINVPLNLVYSDDFNISGTLTDGNNNPLANQTVKLQVGATIVDTGTTNAEGVVSFTQTPVQTGTHSFQLIFEGNDTFNPAYSSSVTREIGKETSVIRAVITSSDVYTDGEILIEGSLTDNDGSLLDNKTIIISENGNVLNTVTTRSGNFNVTISNMGAGGHDLTVSYEGDDNYTSSNVISSIVIKEPYLTVTSDKNILSYVDNDSCILTATYHSSHAGEKQVSFEVRKSSDNSLVETLTGITDVNGECSVVYDSKGAGDLNIKCECMNLQEIYVIEDTLLSKLEQFDSTSESPFNLGTMNSNFILEFDYYPVDYWEWTWIRWDNINHGVWSSSYDKGGNFGITNLGYNKWIHLTYQYLDGVVTMTANSQQTIVTVTDKELPFNVDLYSNKSGTHYKNLKFKRL